VNRELLAYYITWTTYGNWMPGDRRGWRRKMTNRNTRYQPPRDENGIYRPQPLLEAWCRDQMKSSEVSLSPSDRITIENSIREHCQIRGWKVLAVNPRTNHVHVVVVANAPPETVRDQLKANCTRALRQQPVPLIAEKTWATGGDIEFIDDENELECVITYVLDAQD
jgi:REP element-mobilizing transposase RayT